MKIQTIKSWSTSKVAILVALVMAILLVAGGTLATGATSNTSPHTAAPEQVYVGGMPFGVKFYTEGILVVGFCDVDAAGQTLNPARDAGLKLKDVITRVNGEVPTNAEALTAAVEASGGKPVSLTVKRTSGTNSVAARSGNRRTQELTVSVTPAFSTSEGRYKTGLWVRDSGAGIGTVTFIVPGSHAFAGLGHGICDGDTGELVAMGRGQVTDVTVSGVEKGVVGAPGAIKGYFAPGKTGTLLGNTECGVFGLFAALPSTATQKLPVGHAAEVHEGDATIMCTLDDGRIGTYSIRISAIDARATGSKCFAVTVTDSKLIEKTGGIVQGMSGSPIIQDGKLIGAVTHVLINDPTTGYGIFLDNMLHDMPDLLR